MISDFTRAHLSEFRKIEYWRELNPGMNITGEPYLFPVAPSTVTPSDISRCRKQMRTDGYYLQADVLPKDDIRRMRETVLNLAKHGFPPVFGFIYDEFWRAFRDVKSIVEPILGPDYEMTANFWAWNVLPDNAGAGFPPHRDIHRPSETVCGTDGLPLMSTVWIPLTDVTTAHSCMHILPICKDPNLPVTEKTLGHDQVAPEQIMDIRALPATAGSVISWNMEALHWGSSSSEWAVGPRISIAAYLKRANAPGIKSFGVTSKQPLTLDSRLGLISVVLTHYDSVPEDPHRYSKELLAFCAEYLDCQPSETRFS